MDSPDSPPIKRKKTTNGLQEDPYFKAYADINIHEEMIGDRVRTMAYRQAILRNYEQIKGKVVADIGAGTGILSVFCVHAGAKKVYAIEASAMAEQARLIVAENNMLDRIIILNNKVEEVELPEKVDVIVSEWMGYFLLYESMLPSVLHARDKWLKKDGLMLPSNATLYLAPITDPEMYDDRLSFWEEVESLYKVKMSSMIPFARRCLTDHVHVETVPPQDVIAHAKQIVHLNLKTIAIQELQCIKNKFQFQCFGHSRLHGFVSWFSVAFPKDVCLDTSPDKAITHWQQSIVYIDNPVEVKQDTSICGTVSLVPNAKNNRFMDITINYCVDEGETVEKTYLMNDFIT